jgi:hypothetical protein
MGTQSKNYEFFWVDDVSIDVAIPQITSITYGAVPWPNWRSP